jgi:hypothetical protein
MGSTSAFTEELGTSWYGNSQNEVSRLYVLAAETGKTGQGASADQDVPPHLAGSLTPTLLGKPSESAALSETSGIGFVPGLSRSPPRAVSLFDQKRITALSL